MVEQSNGSSWRQRWITQSGWVLMTASSPVEGFWRAPGGGTEVVYGNSTGYDYLHTDWIGNTRIASASNTNHLDADQAYSPYGEIYDIFGSNVAQYQFFAGLDSMFAPSTTTPTMYDAANRELSYASRWLSPDPAGVGWNQYAYTTNPNSLVDPLGLGPTACLARGRMGGAHANGCYPGDPFGGANGGDGTDGSSFGTSGCDCGGLIQGVEGDNYQSFTTTSPFSVGGSGSAVAADTLTANVTTSALYYYGGISPNNIIGGLNTDGTQWWYASGSTFPFVNSDGTFGGWTGNVSLPARDASLALATAVNNLTAPIVPYLNAAFAVETTLLVPGDSGGLTNYDTYVIGNWADTKAWQDIPFANVLNVPDTVWDWKNVNMGWLGSGIEGGQPFTLASPLSGANAASYYGSEFNELVFYNNYTYSPGTGGYAQLVP
jgi:hypothetical protein